jgi:hypothetical protein
MKQWRNRETLHKHGEGNDRECGDDDLQPFRHHLRNSQGKGQRERSAKPTPDEYGLEAAVDP